MVSRIKINKTLLYSSLGVLTVICIVLTIVGATGGFEKKKEPKKSITPAVPTTPTVPTTPVVPTQKEWYEYTYVVPYTFQHEFQTDSKAVEKIQWTTINKSDVLTDLSDPLATIDRVLAYAKINQYDIVQWISDSDFTQNGVKVYKYKESTDKKFTISKFESDTYGISSDTTPKLYSQKKLVVTNTADDFARALKEYQNDKDNYDRIIKLYNNINENTNIEHTNITDKITAVNADILMHDKYLKSYKLKYKSQQAQIINDKNIITQFIKNIHTHIDNFDKASVCINNAIALHNKVTAEIAEENATADVSSAKDDAKSAEENATAAAKTAKDATKTAEEKATAAKNATKTAEEKATAAKTAKESFTAAAAIYEKTSKVDSDCTTTTTTTSTTTPTTNND